MIRIQPVGLFSRDRRVEADGGEVVLLRRRWLGAGAFELDGAEYSIVISRFRRAARLERDGMTIATAESQWLLRGWNVVAANRRLELRRLFGRRTMALVHGDVDIGLMKPDGVFSRGATADFPKELPMEVRIFLIHLVLLLWARRAAAASSGGG